ncbi:MAG: ethanolamine ammonia-lyase subunit EutC [Planctomycetes bacterium]|nr:ethanolamine ammonia-lyase subunit EutC [Planctomycetota bacterium]
MAKNSSVTPDQWDALRSTTSARIALGRAGGSLPTHEWLEFKSAHAAARDAVHNPFDAEQLAAQITSLGVEVVIVESAAPDRLTFLQRPDLGRRLTEASRFKLQELSTSCSPLAPREEILHAEREDYTVELAIIVSDGLSALAVERQAPLLLATLLPKLATDGWRLAPIVVARFGRVALQDEIGHLLGTQLALALIGERPGLGSPDSLGAYLVFAPRIGNTDANRNCVSNIRPEGLPCAAAAETLHYLLTEARHRRLSGVQLKDQRELPTSDAVRSLGSDHRQYNYNK